MTKSQTDKLDDYLDGFLAIEYLGISPLGAILVEDADRAKVLGVVKKSKLEKYIDLSAEPSVETLNFLRVFSHGGGGVSRLLLVLNKAIYDQNWELQKLASSVCRL